MFNMDGSNSICSSATIHVLDMMGNVVLQKQNHFKGSDAAIELVIGALPAGTYILRVQSNEEMWQKTFIKL